jgi:glycosyltransferase involved in cell wall biosynthesis
MNPHVSVLMAVHNGLKYLSQSLESILNQSFSAFEVVVINDGSTDGSQSWLKSASGNDNRIRIFNQENTGLTKSLNRGLALARGKYIARMDADDIALPERLEKQLAAFKQDPDLVLLGTDIELISEDGLKLGRGNRPISHKDIRRELLRGNGAALSHPTVMFPRKLALEIGGYDERFTTTQDLDFFLRMSEKGKMANLNDVLLYWRQHPHSVNRTKSDTWKQMKQLAIEKTIERIGPKRYAEELFDGLRPFEFPSDNLSLGFRALQKNRPETAVVYFRRELKDGPRKRGALFALVNVRLRLISSKLRQWISG